MPLTLTSTAFTHGGAIPLVYTCDGKDVSPPLAWSEVPAGTASFVLIVDDPDAPDPAAPKRVWVHWVLYDIPAATHSLPENVAPTALPQGTRQGVNDFEGRTRYGGPCPPIGRHRYFHKLYAVDIRLGDLGAPTKAQIVGATAGHVLAETELMGTYQRTK